MWPAVRPLLSATLLLLPVAGAGPRPSDRQPAPETPAQGSRHHFRHTETAAVSPQQVWAVWTDVARWPAWDTELRSATLETPFASGVSGRLVPARGRPARFTITDVDPGVRYVMVTDLPGAHLRIERTVVATEDGCRFTHDVSFRGPLARVWSTIYGGRFRRALPGVMRRVRDEAVRRQATMPPD